MAGPTGIEAFAAENLTSSQMSPLDIAMQKVREIVRADSILAKFANNNAARIQALGWGGVRDFSLHEGILIWPGVSTITPGAGVVLTEASVNVSLRFFLGSVCPLGEWTPGPSSLVWHLYRVLEDSKQLLHYIPAQGQSVPLADRCSFSEERSEPALVREGDKTLVMTIGRTVTYNITIDPVTGQPWNFSGA